MILFYNCLTKQNSVHTRKFDVEYEVKRIWYEILTDNHVELSVSYLPVYKKKQEKKERNQVKFKCLVKQ